MNIDATTNEKEFLWFWKKVSRNGRIWAHRGIPVVDLGIIFNENSEEEWKKIEMTRDEPFPPSSVLEEERILNQEV